MKKTNVMLIIKYDGTSYHGWQRLGGSDAKKTIQGVLELALGDLLKENIEIIGSGRTDAGVHAYAQAANFYTKVEFVEDELLSKLNHALPEDIQVIKVQKVKDGFHSRYDSLYKIYEYHIDCREKANVFTRKHTLWIDRDINLLSMQKGASYLLGTHDFKAFSSVMKDGRDTVKTIYSIDITASTDQIIISVKADGFLYNMMRIIVGTLLEVGLGEKKADEMETILKDKNRQKAGPCISGNGLFLKEVAYRS